MRFILLPWKPELVFTGTSVMGINPETNKFCSHLVRSSPSSCHKFKIVINVNTNHVSLSSFLYQGLLGFH